MSTIAPEAEGALDARPDLAAIRAAQARIDGHVHRTPVMTSRALDRLVGAELFFKCENFQKVAAFKARGACNAIFSLSDEEAARGVVTHSSGNHGAAVAWAAGRRGIPAWVVMPSNAASIKRAAVEGLGATVRACEPTVAAREATCEAVQRASGAILVHPFNDWRVIAGQGTATLELLEDAPQIEALVAPIGGGGLISGSALAAHGLRADLEVFGAEPQNADDAARSFASGRIEPASNAFTIADGLRTTLGDKTLGVIRSEVAAIGTASEDAIVAAMRLIWEKLKIVVEASSAVPLAAIVEQNIPVRGLRVGIILTGGNVDLDRLPWQAAAASH